MSDSERKLSRQQFLKRGAAVACAASAPVVLSSCVGQGRQAGPATASVTGRFRWKRYSGQTISLLLNEHPWTHGMQAIVGEFERLTGIKVDIHTFAEDLYYDKMEQALRSVRPVADVYFLPMDSTGFEQYSAGLIAPLSPYLDNPSLTDTSYDLADFPSNFISAVRFPTGGKKRQIYGIPITFETYILFSNRDLVTRFLGGRAPTTMAQLVADAKRITAQGNGQVYGSVMRGIRSADSIMDAVTSVVYNAWGSEPTPLPYNVWFDGAWSKPRLTDARIVEGMAQYAALVAAGPPNALSLDWPDATTLFSQGKAAFYIDASLFAAGFEDPKKSRIAGRVGYAPMPRTDRSQVTGYFAWGLGIPANARRKEAAWTFIQWATNRANTAAIGANTWGAPRSSAYRNRAYTAKLVPQYAETVSRVMRSARSTAVLSGKWKQGGLIIVDAMQAIARGADPARQMAAANRQMLQAFK